MFRALLCLLALLVAPAGGRAQTPTRDNPTPSGGTAGIRGRVVDAASGRPLSRVEIRAAAAGVPQQASGLTDGDGRYDLSGLRAGTYTVLATKANYIRTSWGEQRPEGTGKRITLADGRKLDNIDISLKRAGAVTGTIVDELGDPVTDVLVTAMHYQYIQGSRRLMPNGRGGQTNDIGEFRIYGLSPGQYYISATLRNFTAGFQDTNDRTGYAATLYPGTGNVSEAQRLTIDAGQTVAGINLALLPIKTAKVSGTATDAEGKPMAGAMIIVTQRLGMGQMGGTVAPVRPDGRFTINSLTPGDYTMRLNALTGEVAVADVSVNGGDISDVRLVVTKPSTIRGRVVFTPNASPAVPPKPTAIDLGAVRDETMGRSPARINVDGTFEISSPAGRVLLRAAPAPGGAPTPSAAPPPGAAAPPGGAPTAAPGSAPPWRLNRVIVNDVDVGDTGIDLPADTTLENVVVEMTNRSNEASGRVTDANGNIVRDCIVIVFAQDPARWTVQTRYLSLSLIHI